MRGHMKNNVKVLRKQMGLTQEQLAKQLNVTCQTINAIENNKYNPTLELVMRLVHLLQVSVENLFLLEDIG